MEKFHSGPRLLQPIHGRTLKSVQQTPAGLEILKEMAFFRGADKSRNQSRSALDIERGFSLRNRRNSTRGRDPNLNVFGSDDLGRDQARYPMRKHQPRHQIDRTLAVLLGQQQPQFSRRYLLGRCEVILVRRR